MASPYSPKDEKLLMTEIWDPQIAENLVAFVLFVYPWGKAGTPLERHKGPKTWQRDDLEAMTDHIRVNKDRLARGEEPAVYKQAAVSGRGIGKSTEFAWLTHWMMSCNIGSTTIVTANNETQLKTRTWAELGKWHTLALNGHWFDRTALSFRPVAWFEEAVKQQLKVDTGYYYAQAQLWSEENPEGFAGVHNPHGVMVQFDEASGIPTPIWTVTEGFFTEPELHRYWLAASNGRRNTGTFFECFHKNRAYWRTRKIDARTVEGAALEVLNGIIAQHGEDSDEARIEVLGAFPKRGDNQFIGRDTIEGAAVRELPDPPDHYAPLIMGVDVARFGGASSIIRFRQGRDGRSIPPVKMRGKDNVEVANTVAHWIDTVNPDAVNIDAGNGTGVIDTLRHRKYKVNEIWFGSNKGLHNREAFNKRTDMWMDMREWLAGGCIDNDERLTDDLANPEYFYPGAGDKQSLETKEQMEDRGVASPDDGDALALTFAVRVNRKDRATSRGSGRSTIAKGVDYAIFGG